MQAVWKSAPPSVTNELSAPRSLFQRWKIKHMYEVGRGKEGKSKLSGWGKPVVELIWVIFRGKLFPPFRNFLGHKFDPTSNNWNNNMYDIHCMICNRSTISTNASFEAAAQPNVRLNLQFSVLLGKRWRMPRGRLLAGRRGWCPPCFFLSGWSKTLVCFVVWSVF